MRVKTLLLLVLLININLLGAEDQWNHFIPGGANAMTLEELKSAKINLLTHVPYEKYLLVAAEEVGIKIMPYVDLVKIVKSSGDPILLRNPFWRAVDADTNKHPEWLCIKPDGKIKRPFNMVNYHPGFEQACNNHKSLREAQVKGVEELMKLGCGGVFIDNAGGGNECFGEKLGMHKHETGESFTNAIEDVYKKVKEFGEDKICAINSGFSRNLGKQCDASMIESIVYSFEHVAGNKNEMGRQYWRSPTLYWKNLKSDKTNFTLLQNDVPRIAYSYVTDPCSADEATSFSFAYTKLVGIKMWSANHFHWYSDFPDYLVRRDILRLFYRINNLGKPIEKVFFTDEYAYQAFEKGIVVANASDKTAKIKIPVKNFKVPIAELFTGEELKPTDGNIEITLPFQSGRVIMSKKAVLENYLTEVHTEAKVISDYSKRELEMKNPEFYNPAILKKIDDIKDKIQTKMVSLEKDGNINVSEMNKLSREVSEISTEKIMKETASSIMPNAQNIDKDKIISLLQLQNDEPKVEIFRGGTNKDIIKLAIRTAKSAFVPFHYRSSTFLNLGEDQYFNLASGPIGAFGPSGETFLDWRTRNVGSLLINKLPDMNVTDTYVVPVAFTKLEKISDDGITQKYTSLCEIAGHKSHKKVEDYKLKMNFSVSKGSPFLNLDFSLVDENLKKIDNVQFRFIFHGAKGYISSLNGPHLSTKRQKTPWAYFVTNKNDKMGVFSLGAPELDILKNSIISQGSLKCAIARLSAREHYFLEERIRNLKLYVHKSAALLNNIYLTISPPERFSMAGENQVSLNLKKDTTAQIESVIWKLKGEAVSSGKDCVAPLEIKNMNNSKNDSTAEYLVEVPKGYEFKENDFAYLIAEAEVTLVNGEKFTVSDFISKRLKGFTRVSEFHIFRQQGATEIEAGIKISSLLPYKGKAVLTLNNPQVKLKENSIDFEIPSKGEKQIVFNITAPAKMINKTPTKGLLTIIPEKGKKQKIPVKIKFSPSIDIPHINEKPDIDGKLDEPVWNKAGFKVNDFLFYSDGGKVKDQTSVSVFYTEKALYVGFKCYAKDMGKLLETAIPDENGYCVDAVKNDSFEIYLRPLLEKDPSFYIRIGANTKGVKRNDPFVNVSLTYAGIYSEKNIWRVKTSKYNDRWEAEVEIPFSVIGYQPSKNETWGINFCRNQPLGDGFSSWSCTYGSFSEPNFFGWGNFK